MKHFSTPRIVDEFAKHFHSAGYRCFLVGGALRNIAMKLRPTDFDIATDARPQEVKRLFRRVIPTGIQHGTVTVLFKDKQFEVTTFRTESTYSDSRRPDAVAFSDSIEEDLSRRDFTVNGMALDLISREFFDPHGGMTDLKAKLIRAIGEPADRFREDGLRVMRAVRFATQLGFHIEARTRSALSEALGALEKVSAERIRDELVKIIESPHPSGGLLTMQEVGIMRLILPELSACEQVPQGEGVNENVLTHSIYACEGAPAESLNLRLAALLHDVGKVDTYETDEEGMRFHGHENVSADHAKRILTRLRFSRAVVDEVSHLIRYHMFHYDPTSWTDATVRRFISRLGADHVDDVLLLRRADSYGKAGKPVRDRRLDEFRRHIDEVLSRQSAMSVRDLAVNGNDLHEYVGIPKGPEMGQTLAFLLESVLQDPQQNTREQLLEIARNYYRTRLRPDS
ncbi:MAG: CCA tRNA nucleotidyltransferase [Spirochaetota bacterium]